jgi:hypothetical protein
MATKKSTSPQIANPFAPLEQLVLRALRRYGEMSPSTMDGSFMLEFIDHANSVLDDVMGHPYWKKGVTVPYYTHQTDARPVPDHIMLVGILARFAMDQESSKGPTFVNEFFLKLNQVLAREKFGVGAEFQMQAVDYLGGGVS